MSIAHFSHRTNGIVIAIKTEVERNRVKSIAQGRDIGKQHDLAVYLDALIAQIVQHVLFDGLLVVPLSQGVLQMILVAEIEPIETVVAEEPELFTQMLHLVEVKVKHEHIVGEPVLPRKQAMVCNFTSVEAGIHHVWAQSISFTN